MDLDVKGKRVVIAGASRGIGRAIALAFAAGGAKVSICARGAEALAATKAEIAALGAVVHAQTCDLASESAIQQYIPDAAKALGGIDVLVNNATAAAMDDDEASWEACIAVDLLAVVRASRVALPYLLEGDQPTIINISSGSGLNPSVRAPAYGAAKGAVIHYTRTQAATLASDGIRVNCVAPGSIEFPGGGWERRKTEDAALYKQTLASMPAKRLGTPEEVASVVLFLASSLAIWVTAQVIGVSGGRGVREAALTQPTVAAAVREQTGVAWSRARKLCVEGRVTVNGERCLDPASRIPPGAVVVVDEHAPPRDTGPLSRIAIVHSDRDLVIVDKPAGMLSVADEPGNKETLVDYTRTLLRRMGGRGIDAPLGVVHRLDRDTSGVMVFARTAEAKRVLAAQFRAHDPDRVYHAIAHGAVVGTRIESHLVLDRGDGMRGSHGLFRRAKGGPPVDAKLAVTHLRTITALRNATLVECRLETGRQHQIRIHLSELGHPLVGERVYIRDYAGPKIESPRPMLHARTLGLVHPRTGERILVEREPPEDFQAMVESLSALMPAHVATQAFHFRPLEERDLPMLREWLLRPHVAEWWGPADSIGELHEDYIAHAGEANATRAFIAYLDTAPIGFVQVYVVAGSGGGWWEQETDPGARGTDQFLADDSRLGRGLGSAMIRAFLEELFTDPAVSVVQTDPGPRNLRAIRAYRRAGFQEAGPVDTPDGPALLMRRMRKVEGGP